MACENFFVGRYKATDGGEDYNLYWLEDVTILALRKSAGAPYWKPCGLGQKPEEFAVDRLYDIMEGGRLDIWLAGRGILAGSEGAPPLAIMPRRGLPPPNYTPPAGTSAPPAPVGGMTAPLPSPVSLKATTRLKTVTAAPAPARAMDFGALPPLEGAAPMMGAEPMAPMMPVAEETAAPFPAREFSAQPPPEAPRQGFTFMDAEIDPNGSATARDAVERFGIRGDNAVRGTFGR